MAHRPPLRGGGTRAGGPPTFGTAAGKATIEIAASHLGFPWFSPILLAASVLTGGAVLRVAATVFFGTGSANALSETAPTSGDREPPETSGYRGATRANMWFPSLALVAAGLAVLVAAGFLFGLPLPAPWARGVKATMKRLTGVLRTIHSGYIGDYVIWLVAGLAAMLVVSLKFR
ncbi:hypothetical protein GMSM_34200 [Geomonas sp. Red276]